MSTSSQLCLLRDVCLSLDGLPFTGFTAKRLAYAFLCPSSYIHVEIVNVMPNNLEAAVVLVNLNGQPNIAALPE
jgi:hypothetical protein